MNAEFVYKHVQAVSIKFISYRGQLHALAGFIRQSMGDSGPSIEWLVHILQKERTQKELLDWEVGLWKNSIGDWSLVSLSTPPTIAQMKARLDEYPASNTQCRWCLQDTHRMGHIELINELDVHGIPVHRSRTHKVCMRPWLSMRVQVARMGVINE